MELPQNVQSCWLEPDSRLLLGLQWGPQLVCLLLGLRQMWIPSGTWIIETASSSLFNGVALGQRTISESTTGHSISVPITRYVEGCGFW